MDCWQLAKTKQILKGIQHLRDRGKALATLDNDEILFTEAGAVKIGESHYVSELLLPD